MNLQEAASVAEEVTAVLRGIASTQELEKEVRTSMCMRVVSCGPYKNGTFKTILFAPPFLR